MSAYLTIRSASMALDGISERLIREAVASGELPASRFGAAPKPGDVDRRSIRIAHADLMAWAEAKKDAA